MIIKFLFEQVDSLINSLLKEPSNIHRIWTMLKIRINYLFPNFLNFRRKIISTLRPNTRVLDLGFMRDLKLVSNKNLSITKKTQLDLLVIEELISDFYRAGANRKY